MFDFRITPTTDLKVFNFCIVKLHKYWQSSMSNRIVLVQQYFLKVAGKEGFRPHSFFLFISHASLEYLWCNYIIYTICILVDAVFSYFFFSFILFVLFWKEFEKMLKRWCEKAGEGVDFERLQVSIIDWLFWIADESCRSSRQVQCDWLDIHTQNKRQSNRNYYMT